jgi:hypothetical protein
MPDLFDTSYEDLDDYVGLDEEGRKVASNRLEWLSLKKGQVIRAAFVYFHGVNQNAVLRAVTEAKNGGKPPLTSDQKKAVGRKALEERAAALNKDLGKLTDQDRLDLTEVKFKKIVAHYQEGLGYVVSRLGKDGAEADSVWKRLDEPRTYFTTLMLVYPTNSKGDITEAEKGRIVTDFQIIPWRFGPTTFQTIWKLNSGLQSNNLSIASQDLKLECKNDQYKTIDPTFVGASIWQRNDKFRQTVLDKAIPLYDKLNPFREMTTDQLRSKLGLGGSAVADVAMTDGDFSDLLNNV